MKITGIKELYADMRKKKILQEKIDFVYANVGFSVIFLIDRAPYELLFGVVGHNFVFTLEMKPGFEIDGIPDDIFFRLCNILHLRASRDELTSPKFLRFFESKIPKQCGTIRVQPHEVAVHKQNDIPESEKIYFCRWLPHVSDGRKAQNLEKTRKWLGEEAYKYCNENNISSCWSSEISERRDYHDPWPHK